MVRFKSLFVCLAILLFANLSSDTSSSSEASQTAAKRLPNFLIILTDDQRFDTLTPEIMPRTWRGIVQQGVRFDKAFVTTPLCCPSRSSILTGTLAREHGILRNATNSNRVAFAKMNHFPEDLKNIGYHTAYIGKFLNSWRKGWVGRRQKEFDSWASLANLDNPNYDGYYNFRIQLNSETISYNCAEPSFEGCAYSTDELAQHALNYMDQAIAAKKPFLVYFAPFAPHGPALPAVRHQSLFTTMEPHRPPSFAEADLSDKPRWLQNAPWIAKDSLGNPVMSDGDRQAFDDFRLAQLRTLAAVDEAVDSLLQALKDAGELNNTVVLFTSDNGHFLGEHFLRGKNAPYEEGIHVPFAIRYTKLISPRQSRVDSQHIVANIDIAPTIYDLVEQAIPDQVTGSSLLPLLLNEKTKWRKDLFFEGWPDKPGDIGDPSQCRPPYRAIRNSRYIYIEYEKNVGTGAPCVFETRDGPELYDLSVDPFQLNNLAGNVSYARVESKLAERLKEYPKVEAPVRDR